MTIGIHRTHGIPQTVVLAVPRTIIRRIPQTATLGIQHETAGIFGEVLRSSWRGGGK